jgi:hypothetical protein
MPIVFYHMSPANGTKADRTKQKLIFTQILKYDFLYRPRNPERDIEEQDHGVEQCFVLY